MVGETSMLLAVILGKDQMRPTPRLAVTVIAIIERTLSAKLFTGKHSEGDSGVERIFSYSGYSTPDDVEMAQVHVYLLVHADETERFTTTALWKPDAVVPYTKRRWSDLATAG